MTHSISYAAPPAAAPDAKPRVWPPLVFVGLFWIYALINRMQDLSMFPKFMGLMGASLLMSLGIFIWWMLDRRLPLRQRWQTANWPLAMALVAIGVSFVGFNPAVLLVIFFPIFFTLFAIALLVLRNAKFDTRRGVILFLAAAVFLPTVLIGSQEMAGDGNMGFRWRWVPRPEVKLAGIATTRQSTAALELTSADWPGFRGALRNSRATGVRINTDWKANPPKQLWKQPIGPGWGSMAVVGNFLFTQEQRDDKEAVSCYDASTGKVLWMHLENVRFFEDMAGPGPRATPTFDQGRLYTLGSKGLLTCFEAATGVVLWQKDITKDASAEVPMWAFSSSPLIAHGLAIVFAGGAAQQALLAYHTDTGERAWTTPVGKDSYSSPQLATIDGQDQVLFFAENGVAGVDIDTGKRLWDQSAPSSVGLLRSIQPQPLENGGILIGSEADFGTMLISVKKTDSGWNASQKWSSRSLKPYFNDFVVDEGFIYGFDAKNFSCISLADGKRKWRHDGEFGNGQVLLLADQHLLLILSEEGEAVLYKADPNEEKELGRFQALHGKTWNHPAIAGNRLFVRNGQEIAAFELAPEK